ncbi:unnamed protein product [Auanema sp. JU1783]|nr:unnamed protein product [Auanema sp. JU1783]
MRKFRYKPESLEKLVETTAFTKNELKYLYQSFKQNCPRGFVTKAEFVSIFLSFFNIANKSDAKAYAEYVFNSFDGDSSGTISFSEFVSELSMFIRGSVEERLGWIFQLYDTNRRGYIVEEDILNIARAMYSIVGVHYTKNKHIPAKIRKFLRQTYESFDRSCTTRITKQQFIQNALKNEQFLHSLEVLKSVW